MQAPASASGIQNGATCPKLLYNNEGLEAIEMLISPAPDAGLVPMASSCNLSGVVGRLGRPGDAEIQQK